MFWESAKCSLLVKFGPRAPSIWPEAAQQFLSNIKSGQCASAKRIEKLESAQRVHISAK